MPSESKDITEHEKLSFLEKLTANTPATVTNNAPRIVAGLKILGSTSMLFSKNNVFKIAGAGFITGNTITAIFAKRKTEEEKEKLRQEDANQQQGKQSGKADSYFYKLLHPQKYPIESGASVFVASSAFWTASGIVGKGGFSPARLVGGLFSLASDANVVFTKEKIGEPLSNPYHKGSFKYAVTEMKHRPVLLSSLMNISCDVASIIGGAHEYRQGKEPNTLIAGLFLLSANMFQALFVNKNDYNIEQKATGTHSAKLTKTELVNIKQLADKKPKQSWSDRAQQPEKATNGQSF